MMKLFLGIEEIGNKIGVQGVTKVPPGGFRGEVGGVDKWK
jgi:hypothetical protein